MFLKILHETTLVMANSKTKNGVTVHSRVNHSAD